MFWRGVWGYLPANIIQGLVGFGSIVVFTRLLTPEDFGRYAIAFSVMTLFHVATFSWLEASMARFWAAEKGRSLADHFLTLYRTAAVMTAAVLPVFALILWVLPIGLGLKLAIAAGVAGIPIRCLSKLAQERFRASGAVRKSATLDIFVSLGGFGFGVVAALLGAGAASPLIGLGLAPLLTLPFILPGELRLARGGTLYRERLWSYARYGYPIAAGLGLSLVMASTDRFLLDAFLGPAAVGAYHAGYSLASRTLDVLFIWLGAAGTPALIMAWERGTREGFLAAAREQASTFILIGLPAAVGVALVARPMAEFMIGEDLRTAAASVTPVIALSALLSGITAYYLSQSFVLGRRTDRLLVTLCIPAAANVLLNLALVPPMGVMGAAIATTLSFAVGALASIVMGRRIGVAMPIPWTTLGRCGLASGLMAAVVLVLPAWGGLGELILKAGVGAVVYGMAVLVLNAAGMRDVAGRLVQARTRRATA
ncbi:lipopolysaccharide biosynthesis protein [Brevundimonas aurifodinae]|uniref:Lipopolysaccharide biosynthesis protein n=2 Tax=Brevundimonas TaxID=41275 RepID=A0ABV1NP05_9CAUL|nr:MAG: polysaccharide biosynthesis protein [Brevundimonas sp. 12-68-7]OYX34415.1 MAG: polysaccharide biosynthesis protein [Brevundimonas subvibrioides]